MVEFVCAVCVYCVELAYCAGSGTVFRAGRRDAREPKPVQNKIK